MSHDNIFYVYILLDPRKPGKYKYDKYLFDYEPFYIGKGHGNRDIITLKYDKERCKFKYRKIQNIRKEKLEPIIIKLYENISEDESFKIEIELINLIGRVNLKTGSLTNLTNGGEGTSGYIFTEADKLKMRNAQLGRKHPEEVKKKISDAQRGEKNHAYGKPGPWAGKHLSEETKKKISETRKRKRIASPNLGKKMAEDTKEKIRKAHIGKKASEESKIKMSNSRKGIPKSEEHNRKNSEAHKKRWEKIKNENSRIIK